MSSAMSETTGPAPGSRFTWSGLARRLPIVAVLLLVGTGLGLLGARQQPATYTATATVLVEPADGNPYAPGTRGQNLANLGTEAQLVSSDAVAKIAKSSLRSSASVAALVEQLSVTTPPNSQVLEVAYTDITPVAASNGANAFATAYLVARERRAAESVQAQIDNLVKAQTANQSALQRAVTALSKTRIDTPARTLAEQRVQAATTEATRLETQISDLRLFQGDPGQVLSPAIPPTGAAGLPGWILPVAGAALGLLLGLVIAIWLSLNDRRLRTVDDVKALGFPLLSTVTTTAGDHPEALLIDPGAELPEGARLLRSVLGVASPDGGAILLVPAGAAKSHTTTPLVLAAALARADQTVTLVDTDGELSRAAQLTDVDGLAEILGAKAEPADVVREHQPNLRFVPAGPGHRDSVDKLASPQMREFLDSLAADSRWRLIAGPVASAPETLTLADLCTDVIILVSLRKTTAAELQYAAEAVTRAGATLVGVVVDVPGKQGRAHRTEAAGSVHPVTAGASAAAVEETPRHQDFGPLPRAEEDETQEIPKIGTAADDSSAPADRPDNEQVPAPAPWFPEHDDTDRDDETDFAGSRRTM